MKLTCTQENLRVALSALERVVGKQSTLPILSNILLETEKGQLRLSATNLEIGVITSIGAKIEVDGKITLPAKLLINFIQNLALDQVVSIEQVGTQVLLESGNYTVKINGLDSKDFPIIPERSNGKIFTVEAEAFRRGLQRTLFCVSLNESRPELTGILFGLREGTLYLAATDSFRLAEWRMKEKIEGDVSALETGQSSVIIPAYTLQEVLRVMSQSVGRVSVALEENQIFFEIGSTRIVSRLINGKYPEYQAIIPKQYSTEITLHQDEFQRALKIATSFSAYSSGEVIFRLNPENGWLEIQSQTQGIGEQTARIPYEGSLVEPVQIVFNPRYILEGAAAVMGSELRLALNAPSTPVRISSEAEQEGYTYIVMPIRK
ncbi:MAG: DNA polymerase III subunit beta [Candidatus Moraniibacteriota bacterium]